VERVRILKVSEKRDYPINLVFSAFYLKATKNPVYFEIFLIFRNVKTHMIVTKLSALSSRIPCQDSTCIFLKGVSL